MRLWLVVGCYWLLLVVVGCYWLWWVLLVVKDKVKKQRMFVVICTTCSGTETTTPPSAVPGTCVDDETQRQKRGERRRKDRGPRSGKGGGIKFASLRRGAGWEW